MRTLWNRFSLIWCRTFHPAPYWPTHGRYCCPACLRRYPVPWQEGSGFPNGAEGVPPSPGFVVFEFERHRG